MLKSAQSVPVVYRTIPTSNHNSRTFHPYTKDVVYRTIPTSNHNQFYTNMNVSVLYIVLFLHQTTTTRAKRSWESGLYIVLFLHQTTTTRGSSRRPVCCISYYSYIKPQQTGLSTQWNRVVYRTIPTSNHNFWYSLSLSIALYIVLFLHQTTTIS